MAAVAGRRRTVLVTGADARFAPWLFACLESLDDAGVLARVDLGVLDQGLAADHRALLERRGATLAKPEWPDFVPAALRQDKTLGLAARPLLRDLFPGYDTYLWFDADAWAQSGDFVDAYCEGVRQCGAAVAREDGFGYRKSWTDWRWWVGNHVLAFGAIDGLRLALAPSINIGILALGADAPHWERWMHFYRRTIERTDKINLDQHALQAALCLSDAAPSFVDAAHNWLPLLSTPYWDARRGLLCTPGPGHRPLSVIHLAGPDKTRPYQLLGPENLRSALDYASFRPFSRAAGAPAPPSGGAA